MENFVFPDEIDKTKLMKMNYEHFFMFLKIVVCFFINHLFENIRKIPFSIATSQLLGDFDQTGNHIQTTPRIPSFW